MFHSLSRFFLYASVFSVVIVMISTFFPFIGGKYYFFRVAIELALAAYLLFWGFEAKSGEVEAALRGLMRKPLVIAVSVFVLIYLLASLFAYDVHAAFWSNYERGEGAFQMLHYYAFFLLLVLVMRDKADWERVFNLSLVAAVLMILYGVAAAGFVGNFMGQYRDAEGKPFAPTLLGNLFDPRARFQGSLGNPAYVAPYLMFSMFYALWLRGSKEANRRHTILYGVLLLFLLLFFVLSQTRGAFVGLAVGVVAFLGYLIGTQPVLRKKAVLGLVAVSLFAGTLFFFRETPFIQGLPGSRFLFLDLGERTFQTRLWTWNSAWQGFKERPILGWGPENFSTVFDRYFDPRHFVPGENSETWFDRAHSMMFDYLAETGALGFLSFFGIFVVYFLQLFRRGGALSPLERATLFSLPIAYLVQGLVIFDVLPIYVNLFLFLAFSTALFKQKHAG